MLIEFPSLIFRWFQSYGHRRLRLIFGLWACGLSLALLLTGCPDRPTISQLEQWHQEAIAENQRLNALYADAAAQQQWTLMVDGQTSSGQPTRFDWPVLQSLAQNHVPTREPHPNSPETIFDFRGVPVSTVLEKVGTQTGVQDVTFLAFDAFRATIPIEDLKRYPILLAIERNGQPIPRAEGGPLYLVLPTVQFPELKQRYDSTYWVFYVTHMVLGTEEVRLKVGDRRLSSTDLDRLPQSSLDTPVGYRLFWPSGSVKLQGVRLQDVFQQSGINLPDDGYVVVRGKASISRDPKKPMKLAVKDLQSCKILLVSRWGDQLEPIPARMGGPLTLAFAPECPDRTGKQQPWMTFVEELEMMRP